MEAVESVEEEALEEAVDWGRRLSCIQVAQVLYRTDRSNGPTAVAHLSTVSRKVDEGGGDCVLIIVASDFSCFIVLACDMARLTWY